MANKASPDVKVPPNSGHNPSLEWIRFREETLGPAAYQNSESKLLRKIKENPLIPIGCFTTLGVLSYGLWCFRKGRMQQSQNMMRARIAAQAFTVFALLGGMFWNSSSPAVSNSEKASNAP